MIFNDSILIKNLLVVSLRKKWGVYWFICLEGPKAVWLASGTVGSRDSNNIDKIHLTSAFLSAGFFIGMLCTSFSLLLQFAISQGKRSYLVKYLHLFPQKEIWPWMSLEHFPCVREVGWVGERGGNPWLTVLSETNRIKEAEVPKEKVAGQCQKNRYLLSLQTRLSGYTVIHSTFTFRLFLGLVGRYYVVINILILYTFISLDYISISGITGWRDVGIWHMVKCLQGVCSSVHSQWQLMGLLFSHPQGGLWILVS